MIFTEEQVDDIVSILDDVRTRAWPEASIA